MSNITQATTYTKIKQPTDRDARQFGPLVHDYETQVSTASQTVINLARIVCNISYKSSIIVVLDGQILTEGAGNDYTWTNVGNNLSSQITLATSIPVGLNIQVYKIGATQQAVPNANSIQADLNSSNLRLDGLVSNYCINGGFDFWQRNTTFATVATTTYTADRWQYVKSGAMVHTVARNTSVPSTSKNPYALLIDCTTADASIAAGDFCAIQQKIEGINLRGFKSKNMVLAFDVYSAKTGVHCVSFRNSASDRSLVKEYTVSVANTWERKYIRFNHDATGTWLYDTGIGMNIAWALAAGTTFQTTADIWQSGNFMATSSQVNVCDNTANDFKLADVTLIEDNVSTTAQPEFRYVGRSYVDELTWCERYFEKSYSLDTAPGTITNDGKLYEATSQGVGTFALYNGYRTPKRAAGTPTTYNPITGTANNIRVSTNNNAFTLDASNIFSFNGSVSSALDTQVQWHYTAEAEL